MRHLSIDPSISVPTLAARPGVVCSSIHKNYLINYYTVGGRGDIHAFVSVSNLQCLGAPGPSCQVYRRLALDFVAIDKALYHKIEDPHDTADVAYVEGSVHHTSACIS